jgi:putative ABC transport system substrate-binding protein
MRRRDLLAIVSGAALVVPHNAGAEQRRVPIIGYLNARSAAETADIMTAFQSGLRETGFSDKQSVRIEARFAEGHFDLLPQLTADLVRQGIDLLVATGGTVTVVKAKPIVPYSILIVFATGGDPVKLGIVASLHKPGGNITGITFLVNGLAAKCVELLHDMAPHAEVIGLLVNPKDPNQNLTRRTRKRLPARLVSD